MTEKDRPFENGDRPDPRAYSGLDKGPETHESCEMWDDKERGKAGQTCRVECEKPFREPAISARADDENEEHDRGQSGIEDGIGDDGAGSRRLCPEKQKSSRTRVLRALELPTLLRRFYPTSENDRSSLLRSSPPGCRGRDRHWKCDGVGPQQRSPICARCLFRPGG
jgi:hypothetical protein